MMKIAMVMAGDEEGGLEKHVVELTNGLKCRGHTVTLIAHEKYQIRVEADFIAVDLSKSRRNLFTLYHLYKVIKKLQPDIIHVHGNKAAAMVGSLLPYLDFPSIATLHSRKKNTKMFRKFNTVIAVSPNAAEVLNHPNVLTVLNGITPPVLNPNILKNDPPVVLAVGRLVPVKGFDVLLHAWKSVQGAELWIVGEGFEESRLKAFIHEHGLSDSVKMLGFRDDVLQLMQKSSLYVMSSHYEGCPYTMVEALLCEIPMVSTAVGAMTMLLPQKNLTPVNDASALATAINRCLENLAQAHQDCQESFAYAKQYLVLDGMITQIEKAYRDTTHS